MWEKILAHLVEKARKDAVKSAEPHDAFIDSQSVKTVPGNEKRGIDGKKTKGHKRHAVVDTMGNLLGIVVHAANIHDTKLGILAAQKACEKSPSIQAFFADVGYLDTFIDEIQQQLRTGRTFPRKSSRMSGKTSVALDCRMYLCLDECCSPPCKGV